MQVEVALAPITFWRDVGYPEAIEASASPAIDGQLAH